MSELWFYRLEGRTIADVLPQLLEKSLERGWRTVVECGNPDAIPKLSQRLWSYRDVAFIAHGHEGEGAQQPIWLTAGPDNPNHAQARLYVEGAVPGDVSGLDRAMYIFEKSDETAIEAARERWKLAKAEGLSVRYFIYADGKWAEQKG